MKLANVLQTHHVYSTLKRRGNDRFNIVSTWNTQGVFVGWNITVSVISFKEKWLYRKPF